MHAVGVKRVFECVMIEQMSPVQIETFRRVDGVFLVPSRTWIDMEGVRLGDACVCRASLFTFYFMLIDCEHRTRQTERMSTTTATAAPKMLVSTCVHSAAFFTGTVFRIARVSDDAIRCRCVDLCAL